MKVTPPAVPMPGMDGGEKAKACASGSLLNSLLRRVLTASNFSFASWRWLHYLSVTKKNTL
jgi:hypothetical protein